METLHSYVKGNWYVGGGKPRVICSALNGEAIYQLDSSGIDNQAMLAYGREKGSRALAGMTFLERATMLKEVAKCILAHKEELYALAAETGATRTDSWIDIEGGAATFFNYASLANRELPNDTVWPEDDLIPLSKEGTFAARHILTSKPGVAVHINAYNFPCWGMLEKLAPTWLGGMAAIVKPASDSAYVTQAVVRIMVDSGLVPEGAIQLVCGSTGDLLDCLDTQDVVTFTGSAQTGQMLRATPNLIEKSIPFTMEADSVNCAILGDDVTPESPEFALFVKEVCREMTVKAGQKCTAIRRAMVPQHLLEATSQALVERLSRVVVGDPAQEGVTMGALISQSQRDDVQERVTTLSNVCRVVTGGTLDGFEPQGAAQGAYYPPTLLVCDDPFNAPAVHDTEAFGPVCTLMPYQNRDEAVSLAKLGQGSLVGSLVTASGAFAADMVARIGHAHGRLHVLNAESARESTGHGSPLPMLVHGGPGRAGGGEEMGGLRGVKHYMQRTAIQGSPTMLAAIGREWVRGAEKIRDVVHPFRKHFEDIAIGESLTTARRTITEADIVNFACLSGDHFYAHMDEIAARESMFGQRVAHGYFVISAAAGLFVEAAPGPVLANYGMENLRFIEPVVIGDTIQVHLTCQRKIKKPQRRPEDVPQGVIVWDVEVVKQDGSTVASYSILTLVARREGDVA
ncbi:phenylacetic acid degradation bifunctional protein PaaZ [Photobacterium ganghwense]|uniref:Enoyl-CoA hydratase n=1 Tax=Photobacterium ganghwense TaxID=320778 RepID=A0A0J1HDY4_9GAMM|nr:phenylacetic acid degradation bifunctional protein PaaZ [Photobacterium ganghwense]KLV09860.1 enoyl-CoA hydratase [Photobacterium ganghwense]PSU09297.1 phenylacetic acid degradation bifunctional protein PaaZ [Photobacterium ganghwense]QSV16485.1 phenylacetic acid degradation bifunctional protein PaaZ [Photobacterium ganghwense]